AMPRPTATTSVCATASDELPVACKGRWYSPKPQNRPSGRFFYGCSFFNVQCTRLPRAGWLRPKIHRLANTGLRHFYSDKSMKVALIQRFVASSPYNFGSARGECGVRATDWEDFLPIATRSVSIHSASELKWNKNLWDCVKQDLASNPQHSTVEPALLSTLEFSQ
ncbi:MAG: hypothetical protein V4562_04060, partial [Pseudomonadota bacterium]